MFALQSEPEKLRGSYASAVKEFKRIEAELGRALDALAAARAGDCPGDITRTRLAARDAERASGAAWEACEIARRAYWNRRAADLEAQLAAEAVPQLVQLAAFQRFAGLPAIPAEHLLRHHLLIAPLAHTGPDDDVSADPLASPQLDRADDEI
ncbi:hypothetical protein ACFDAU_06250 [Sulfuriferula sp. GW1]|uniref:hypothetical protein n=1 Tax=Sulfuriferula sp. GW1 TaxID=3345111 RepID=UPI0039B03B33